MSFHSYFGFKNRTSNFSHPHNFMQTKNKCKKRANGKLELQQPSSVTFESKPLNWQAILRQKWFIEPLLARFNNWHMPLGMQSVNDPFTKFHSNNHHLISRCRHRAFSIFEILLNIRIFCWKHPELTHFLCKNYEISKKNMNNYEFLIIFIPANSIFTR